MTTNTTPTFRIVSLATGATVVSGLTTQEVAQWRAQNWRVVLNFGVEKES